MINDAQFLQDELELGFRVACWFQAETEGFNSINGMEIKSAPRETVQTGGEMGDHA